LQDVPQLIENVEEIEKDQQRLRELKQLQDDGNHLESRISSLVLKLRNYKDIDEVNNLLNNIKTLQEKLTANILLRQLYQKYTQDVRVAENVLEKTKHVNEIEKTLNDTEIVLNSMHNLRNTKAEYQTTKNQLNALNTKLDAFKDIQETEKILITVESDEKRLAVLKGLYDSYVNENQLRNDAVFNNNNAIEDYHTAEYVLQQAWNEAGGVCPLCEQAHEGGIC